MEEQYQKKFIIENLDLEETSLDEILQQKESEFMGIEDLNIFYSSNVGIFGESIYPIFWEGPQK